MLLLNAHNCRLRRRLLFEYRIVVPVGGAFEPTTEHSAGRVVGGQCRSRQFLAWLGLKVLWNIIFGEAHSRTLVLLMLLPNQPGFQLSHDQF